MTPDILKAAHSDSSVLTSLHQELTFYISPVLICKAPKRTVGLGDAISSMGLVRHPFAPPAKYAEEKREL